MSNDFERPIIIKRKKVVGGGGHHGGAWKVAYADFVTAMMAFFMLMWLLNATTENQRKGLADYFSPEIPIARVSGGGDGAMGGSSAFSQDTLARDGVGGIGSDQGVVQQAFGTAGTEQALREAEAEAEAEEEALAAASEALLGLGGDSLVEELALTHVQTRLTDEGLVVEVFDADDNRLFEAETDVPTANLVAIASMIARVATMVDNPVAIEGYTRARAIVEATDITWDLSSARAHRMRALLSEAGFNSARVQRVTGHADRSPKVAATMDIRNNRIEVVFLRVAPGRR
jgi:chemotaxis protein MotB